MMNLIIKYLHMKKDFILYILDLYYFYYAIFLFNLID